MDNRTDTLDSRCREFEQLAQLLLERLPPSAHPLIDDVVAALPDWNVPRDVTDLGRQFEGAIDRAYEVLDDDATTGLFSAALVASLVSGLPPRLRDRRLPPDVVAQVPPALDRLLAFLRSADLTGYRWAGESHDFFLKDIRFAAGLTVPVGAGVVDLRNRIGFRRTVALAVRRRSPTAVAALLRGDGLEPWFAFHTESRYLEEFDEAGWDRAYLRLAALLIEHPEVHGLRAAGWLYDPQLTVVSPRHAYLYQRPLERGALLLREKAQQHDIDNALAKSERRRRMYEAGEYVPQPHILLWPRRAVLAWARAHRASPT